MSRAGLPVLLRIAGEPVILIGDGTAAEAKRRVLERAGARVVQESAPARIAVVALEADGPAEAAVARLHARGILVNAVDRAALCDFTFPAIVDRDPVQVAVSTGGASAGLAAALRQRLEAMLPSGLGALARALDARRSALFERWPDSEARRRALATALAEGGPLDPFREGPAAIDAWLAGDAAEAFAPELHCLAIASPDPDDLTLRQARLLARADRVHHGDGVPAAILDRARADAPRIPGPPPAVPGPGITLYLEVTS